MSGGPDSLGLLRLSVDHADRPLSVATVDHGLRDGSAEDGERVAALCAGLGLAHTVLKPVDPIAPRNVQAEARQARYRALAIWASERGVGAVATGHQMDDQAETLAMRLARGSGAHGLAGVRDLVVLRHPDAPTLTVVRPCLTLRRAELAQLVRDAGWQATDDPANDDDRHDRTRIRRLLPSDAVPGLARSAGALAEVSDALAWAEERAAALAAVERDDGMIIRPDGLPAALRRALLQRAIGRMRPDARPGRGPELDRMLAVLTAGGCATLRGLRFAGGPVWTVRPVGDRHVPDCKAAAEPYLEADTKTVDCDA